MSEAAASSKSRSLASLGMTKKDVSGDLLEEFGGDVDAAAKAFDVVLVEFALAAENFGDNAGDTEDIGEIFLQEAAGRSGIEGL